MKICTVNRWKTVWLSLSVLACARLHAATLDTSVDRYSNIVTRNAFGLRSPEPVQIIQPPRPLPKVLLNGLTTILGDKRALIKVVPVAGKPGEQPKENFLVLGQGQREGEIEVLEINEKAGSVAVDNSGTRMTLTLDQDGEKLAPATPPVGHVVGAAPPGGPVPAFGAVFTNAPQIHMAGANAQPHLPNTHLREALSRARADRGSSAGE